MHPRLARTRGPPGFPRPCPAAGVAALPEPLATGLAWGASTLGPVCEPIGSQTGPRRTADRGPVDAQAQRVAHPRGAA
eukprot:645379-Pyramimonas_sp.AAC.1